MTQQALGAHHYQRLAIGTQLLAAQHVIHLRRCGRVADLHVVFRAQLQITLETRRGMLGALAVVAMGQQHHEAAIASPLFLAGGDELIDDDLRAVGEIAELRFPDHQRIGLSAGVAEFIAEHRFFRERRVDDQESGLIGAQVLQRQTGLAGLLIVDHRVTMEEGATRAILPRDAHRATLAQQGRIGECFGEAPVAGFLAERHRAPVGQHAGQGTVQSEILGHGSEAIAEALDALCADRGRRRMTPVGATERFEIDRVAGVGDVGVRA